MASPTQILGTQAEQNVDGYLQREGWVILDRNFRTRRGELDRVALDGTSLVFVEIKARRKRQHFEDFSPLLARQRQRILLTARYYLCKNGDFLEDEFDIQEYRFDYVYVCDNAIVEHHRGLLLGQPMRPF
jgi:putative endonuclease